MSDLGLLSQDADKVRQPVLFIWSVRSVSSIWLNQTNQIDQMDQTDRTCPARLSSSQADVRAIEVLLPKWFFRSLLEPPPEK